MDDQKEREVSLERLVDDAIRRNEASIQRLKTRIDELCQLLEENAARTEACSRETWPSQSMEAFSGRQIRPLV